MLIDPNSRCVHPALIITRQKVEVDRVLDGSNVASLHDLPCVACHVCIACGGFLVLDVLGFIQGCFFVGVFFGGVSFSLD